MIDKKIHEVFKALKNGVRWHDFSDVGIDEHYLMYYYAQDRLYVILDCMIGNYYFVEAGSPGKALEKYRQVMEEAAHAGEWVAEDAE